MSDYNSNDDSGKVTITDANEARHGYADEEDIAKRQYGLDTPQPNENPVRGQAEVPSEKPTMALGAQIENQDELMAEVQTEEGQDFETADETVEMVGSNSASFKADRDIRWGSAEGLDRGEYETKSDAEVAENLGLAHLPEADQSDKEPIPELVDRRAGEDLAGYEKRVGEEADHARMAREARAIAEPSEATTVEESTEEPTFETAKYTAAWVTEESRPDEEDEMSPTRQRAESTRVAADKVAAQPEVPPEPEHEQAGQLDRDLAGFEERAKLAAGLEPTEAWSPIERIGEEIIELGQSVEDIVEKVGITEKQALILLAEMRLESDSALDAAMKAVEQASSYFKVAPTPIQEVHPRQYTTTVEGTVTRLFTPMNASEYQVAHVEDRFSGEMFKFIIHERTRFSRSWTEWNGDIVTDLHEGDEIRIIDGKPHYSAGRGINTKIHASQWTVIQKRERGDGKYVSRHAPRDRVITEKDWELDGELDEPAVKSPAAYNIKQSTLDQRRAKTPNGASQDTDFERRATADPTLVQWKYPTAWIPDQHMHHYEVEESSEASSK
ncbi:hypothetical protein [Haloarcula sp. 1CSR25-25]|jgi:hypothetical protein|uniref:hypothetical protein n=1 Tax=Haloarcula sp. 1CSR25-25 TaxID=2862545 RepID=UPI0028948747|nr:hypothetical protein [Haloarcula sp. 1CSR25-25]MDT3437801.1 hypothetical protein [Haloarcula sp. 1CSR25-25]